MDLPSYEGFLASQAALVERMRTGGDLSVGHLGMRVGAPFDLMEVGFQVPGRTAARLASAAGGMQRLARKVRLSDAETITLPLATLAVDGHAERVAAIVKTVAAELVKSQNFRALVWFPELLAAGTALYAGPAFNEVAYATAVRLVHALGEDPELAVSLAMTANFAPEIARFAHQYRPRSNQARRVGLAVRVWQPTFPATVSHIVAYRRAWDGTSLQVTPVASERMIRD